MRFGDYRPNVVGADRTERGVGVKEGGRGGWFGAVWLRILRREEVTIIPTTNIETTVPLSRINSEHHSERYIAKSHNEHKPDYFLTVSFVIFTHHNRQFQHTVFQFNTSPKRHARHVALRNTRYTDSESR